MGLDFILNNGGRRSAIDITLPIPLASRSVQITNYRTRLILVWNFRNSNGKQFQLKLWLTGVLRMEIFPNPFCRRKRCWTNCCLGLFP